MSFDEHPTPTTDGQRECPLEIREQPKPKPEDLTPEDIAKMSLKDLADIAGSMEPAWTGFGGWCSGECR
jgi:hypothetical protein